MFRRRSLKLVAMAVGAVSAADSAPGMSIRSDRDDNSYKNFGNEQKFAGVGAVNIFGSQLASGTLIAPKWVLTAGHVVDSSTFGLPLQFNIGGTTATNGTTYGSPGGNYFPHPSWSSATFQNGFDIGLMKLDMPVSGVKPSSRFNGTSNLLGQVGTSVGFGIYGTGSNPGTNQDGRKRAGQNVIDALGSVAYPAISASDNIIASDFDNDPAHPDTENAFGGSVDPLNLECCVSSGDSGGGVFVDVGAGPEPRAYLAAVHSFVEALDPPSGDNMDDSDYGDTYGSTRVSIFNSWIDDNITVKWSNAAGGAYASGSNWTGGVAPAATDVVGFNTAGTYNVTFAGDVSGDRIIARSGNVTLALANHTYSLTSLTYEGSLIVGRYGGNNASMIVSNGTLNTRDIVLAEQTGSTGTLTVAAGGTLNVTGDVYLGGSFVAPGGSGTLNLNGSTPTSISGQLQLFGGGRVFMSAGGNKVLKVGSLAIDTAAGGKLDLANNKLIVGPAPGANPGDPPIPVVGTLGTGNTYTGVTGLIQSGRNGNAAPLWDGSGIVTSQTSATTGNFTSIGVATAQQVKGLATATDTAVWGGQTVTGADTLAMYTYGGDANLDGKINVDDYGHIDSSIGIGLVGWFNGDFNYDGKINVDDYGIIDFNIGIQGPPFATADTSLSAGAVPEPAAAFILAAGLFRPRRRRRETTTKDGDR